jgi:hypothetical protein
LKWPIGLNRKPKKAKAFYAKNPFQPHCSRKGGETDVCVLSTVLGAVDFGFRVIVVYDAVCSSSDAAHDAMQLFYSQRLPQQVETASTEEVLDSWVARRRL